MIRHTIEILTWAVADLALVAGAVLLVRRLRLARREEDA